MKMFTVRYIYSACVVVETSDVKVLCDPWFTQGIYDGSWFHHPLLKSPADIIGDMDVIYVSHIHPDHYDPAFLRSYFKKYGRKRIIIPSFKNNYLRAKMAADGFQADDISLAKYGDTELRIFPNITDSLSDIDSALLVNRQGIAFLNLNDCIWEDNQSKAIRECLDQNKLDLRFMALGYAGAGPYPQTYYDKGEQLDALAKKKKQEFFGRYKRNIDYFGAKRHLPFAGKYILGGKLASLNQLRGVPDPLEVVEIDPKAVILDDGGQATFDLINMTASALRTKHYEPDALRKRLSEISSLPMRYELEFKFQLEDIGFHRLLSLSYERALKRSELGGDYFFVINILDGNGDRIKRYLMNANPKKHFFREVAMAERDLPEPRSEIAIDYRYLFGLLTSVYHWNNAEVGSQFTTRRYPDVFNRSAQRFLNFLALC